MRNSVSFKGLSKRTVKAINLLDTADQNNPNKDDREAAELKLIAMRVVDTDGSIIDTTENKQLNDWWELNRT